MARVYGKSTTMQKLGKGKCKMTGYQLLTTDRDTGKSRLEETETQDKTVTDHGGEPSGSVTVSDIGSPYGTTEIQQSYESVDFGESGEELI